MKKCDEENLDSLINDSQNVALLVEFIMNFLGRRSGRLTPYDERCTLKINIETAVMHSIEEIRPQMECFFKENWKHGFSDKEFKDIIKHAGAIHFKKYSAIEFLKYSCKVCLLAFFAFDKERKAPRVAKEYILEVVQKYRLKKQFDDKKWTFMNAVLFHYLIDNNILP